MTLLRPTKKELPRMYHPTYNQQSGLFTVSYRPLYTIKHVSTFSLIKVCKVLGLLEAVSRRKKKGMNKPLFYDVERYKIFIPKLTSPPLNNRLLISDLHTMSQSHPRFLGRCVCVVFLEKNGSYVTRKMFSFQFLFTNLQ